MITLSQEIYDALCSDPVYDEIEEYPKKEVTHYDIANDPNLWAARLRRTSILNDF